MATKLRTLLDQHEQDIALVIGNGINRYGTAPSTNSWQALLEVLSKKILPAPQPIPEGVSLTEVYDLLALQHDSSSAEKALQKQFCELMQDWQPYSHHRTIVSWARRTGCPLLTTNFEKVLARAGDCTLLHITREGFSDYYPWATYYGNDPLDLPESGFGIWHINGMEHYHRSIRLGLSHYMGSVTRARDRILGGGRARLFSSGDIKRWRGSYTWLHLIFSRSLVILGLGLDTNEVFLRWLLIVRAQYFRKFPDRRKRAWYLHTNEPDGSGKLYFLSGVGVEPFRVGDYDELYGADTWS